MSSVRFICGTQDIHKELERKLSEFLGMEETILYGAAFDENGELFKPLLGEGDEIISDEVPRGQARIRVQLSASHKKEDLDFAIASFIKEAVELNLMSKKHLAMIKSELKPFDS